MGRSVCFPGILIYQNAEGPSSREQFQSQNQFLSQELSTFGQIPRIATTKQMYKEGMSAWCRICGNKKKREGGGGGGGVYLKWN